MDREILYRAKPISDEHGDWAEGIPIKTHIGTFIVYEENPHYCTQYGYMEIDDLCKVDEETLCQYTGLTDKNGEKIWENDIIKAGGNLAVHWNEKFASWCLSKEGWLYNHFFGEAVIPEDCEVIGNIFDNPELLKEGAS